MLVTWKTSSPKKHIEHFQHVCTDAVNGILLSRRRMGPPDSMLISRSGTLTNQGDNVDVVSRRAPTGGRVLRQPKIRQGHGKGTMHKIDLLSSIRCGKLCAPLQPTSGRRTLSIFCVVLALFPRPVYLLKKHTNAR